VVRAIRCTADFHVIATGYGDGTFRPANKINFAEAAKMLSIGFHVTDMEDRHDAWYGPYVSGLQQKNAIPFSIHSFDQVITRAEMAEMIIRLELGQEDSWHTQTYEALERSTAVLRQRGNVDYLVRYAMETENVPFEEGYDGEVVTRNVRTGERTVLVKSVKTAVEGLRSTFNLTLEPFALPANSSLVIFRTVLKETDNAGGTLYAFDPSTKRFTEMCINDSYNGSFDGAALSPMQDRIVWTKADSQEHLETGLVQQLFAGNLTDDSFQLIEELHGEETFNGYEYGLATFFDLEWTQPYVLRYGVFDQDLKNRGQMGKEALIEQRTLKVK